MQMWIRKKMFWIDGDIFNRLIEVTKMKEKEVTKEIHVRAFSVEVLEDKQAKQSCYSSTYTQIQ